MEFLKLKHQYKLYQIYPQIDLYLESFLKLHTALKKRGLSPSGNVEQFVDTIEIGESKTILRIVVWVFGYRLTYILYPLQCEAKYIDNQKKLDYYNANFNGNGKSN